MIVRSLDLILASYIIKYPQLHLQLKTEIVIRVGCSPVTMGEVSAGKE